MVVRRECRHDEMFHSCGLCWHWKADHVKWVSRDVGVETNCLFCPCVWFVDKSVFYDMQPILDG